MLPISVYWLWTFLNSFFVIISADNALNEKVLTSSAREMVESLFMGCIILLDVELDVVYVAFQVIFL